MSSLPTRRLGKDGPLVTALGYGCMGLSGAYASIKPDNERFALLDKCYELGEWNWDTADVYGDNEDLLGKWFSLNPEKRKDIFFATKFSNKMNMATQSYDIDSSPEYCKMACEKSLKRLGLDYIDLYYVHRVDGKTPIEKTMRAMVELQNEGRIKYIGLSECSATTLRRASKIATVSAVQVEYSPWSLDIESPQIDLLRTCRELGVAVVAYSPTGRGMFSGTIRTRADLGEGRGRNRQPRFSEENFGKNLVLVDQIVEIAKTKSVTPVQLVLAWLLKQGEDIIPIPGTTDVGRLVENVGCFGVLLSDEEEKGIRVVVERAEVSGERYPAGFMDALFGNTPEE